MLVLTVSNLVIDFSPLQEQDTFSIMLWTNMFTSSLVTTVHISMFQWAQMRE